MPKSRIFVAELIGTFALVFVGAAASIYGDSLGILGIALAHGLALAVFVYVFGAISGAHLNPAVTLGLASNGNLKWSDAATYWLAQFVGAIMAGLVLWLFVNPLSSGGGAFAGAATTGLLTTGHPYYAIVLEVLLTFFLMTTFLHASVDGKPVRPSAAWAIGATYAIAVLAGNPLTGGSLNPARSFGPAIFTSAITAGKADYLNIQLYLIYFMGPFIGAVLAALLYRFFKVEATTEKEVEEVEEIVEKPVARRVTRK